MYYSSILAVEKRIEVKMETIHLTAVSVKEIFNLGWA